MKNVLLVFGGKSFEHDISIITALIVQNQYKNGKYNFVPLYVDKNNEWFYFAGEKLSSSMFSDFEKTHAKDKFFKAYLKINQNYLFFKQGLFERKIQIYASLNCCHGGVGESGELTSVLSFSNIPTSAGSHTALGISMDKMLSKLCFSGLSIPNLEFVKATKKEWIKNKNLLLKKIENIGFPFIVKPAQLGSSIGISIAKDRTELEKSVEVGFEFDDVLLCEKAILEKMKEFNIACMKKDGKVILSEIDQPIKTDEILSFKDKYIGEKGENSKQNSKLHSQKNPPQKGGAYVSEKQTIKCDVPEKISKQIKEIAKKVYEELGLFGVVRIDFICDKKNNVFLNEINAVPGSLGYYFFVPSHFKTMSGFIDCLVDEGVSIFQEEKNIKKEFITKLF